MAKWAFFTVLLYVLLAAVLFGPVVLWASFRDDPGFIEAFEEFFEALRLWQFWLVMGVVLLIEAALLFIPVRVATEALQPKRHIWIPATAAGAAFAVLVIGFVWSITMAIWGDDILVDPFLFASGGLALVNWVFWTIVFRRFSKTSDARGYINRLTRWLIRGSILELLVAVPSHIIVRHRDECCAPGFSFFGIAGGLAVMGVAFGPGLFFLFYKRFEQMKPRSKRAPI